VPTAAFVGVIGTLNKLLAPLVNEFGFVQVTTCELIVQLQPLLVNGADGGVIPDGMITVVEIGPLAGAVPMLLTVTGIFDVMPAVNAGIVPTVVVKSGAVPDWTGVVGEPVLPLLLVTTSPLTGAVFTTNEGIVPIELFVGVTGTLKKLLVPLIIELGFVQLTTCPAMVQFQPLLENGADGGVMPVGIVIVVEIGPLAGAVPILLTVTGIFDVTPAVKVGTGPTAVIKSGAVPAWTGKLAVELPELLFVIVSPETGEVIAVKVGVVPTELFVGVTGMLNKLLVPLVNEFGFEQITFCPEVVQFQPLLINGATGGVIPAGILIVVEIGPVAEALPIFATVTGIFEVTPAVKTGIVPTEVVKSGAGAAATGEVGEAGGDVLLGVIVSPTTGAVTAVKAGVVPTEVFVGVIGTLKTEFVPLLIGPGFMQVTFWPDDEQFQPLLVNGAEGGVIPVGTLNVVEIGPVAGAVPILATVTGILEVTPAVKAGTGPTVVVKSGEVATAQEAAPP
jgi:hypothetical protein